MKFLLTMLLLTLAGSAISQDTKNATSEDNAASRLIRKKREKIQTTKKGEKTSKDSRKKDE
jgi:hypothetical protein